MSSVWTMARLDRRVPIRSGGWGVGDVSTILSDDEGGGGGLKVERGGIPTETIENGDVFIIQRHTHKRQIEKQTTTDAKLLKRLVWTR